MGWWQRFANTVRPGRNRREIEEELRLHLELRARDGGERGGRFGSLASWQERTQDGDVLIWLESWLLDARHALRQMRRSPGFTAMIMLTLAVGIGANAAIFSLVNAVLLRTLPVPHPEQIYALSQTNGHNRMAIFSFPEVQQFASGMGRDGEVGAFSSIASMPLFGSQRQDAAVQLVSAGYFPTLQLQPRLGRFFSAGEDNPSRPAPVAVISYAYWQGHLGGAADVLGKTIALRHATLTVVGVAPSSFRGFDPGQSVDVWAPLAMQAPLQFNANRLAITNDHEEEHPWMPQDRIIWLSVFARLRHPAAAAAIANRLTPAVEQSWKRIGSDLELPHRVAAEPAGHGGDSLRKAYGQPLEALIALVGLMLLIAIANVATLLLSRLASRRREIAIRLAVGVSRVRLARQLLTESLLLALAAGAAALALAFWGSRLLAGFANHLNGGPPLRPDLDWRVWGFLAAAALGAGLLIGLLPALQAARRNPVDALKSGSPAGAGHASRIPFGRWLVIAQIALSLLLVASAGLFSRSLAAMFHQNLGFDPAGLINVRLASPDPPIPAAQWPELRQRILAAVAAVPGVRTAAFSTSGIDNFSTDTSGISLAGTVSPPGGLSSNEDTVTRAFFAATGMRLVRGRSFDASDGPHTQTVVVVNQAFARKFYPGSALGKTFGYNPGDTSHFEIIGIVANARVNDPHKAAVPLFYRLASQAPERLPLTLEVRADGPTSGLATSLQQAIQRADAALHISQLTTLQHRLEEMLGRDRLIADLSTGFGALALALACLGLFGVMSYAVAARTPEFGIRLALGAPRPGILRLVLGEETLLVLGGLALGLPLTLGATHLLQPLLPGVAADDPAALATAVVLLALLPLTAGLRPAWRATRVDPARTLRAE